MRTTPQNMFLAVLSTVLLVAHSTGTAPQTADLKPEIFRFDPFTWPSEIPRGCPFIRSGAVLHRPAPFVAPASLLKLSLGEAASWLLEGQRVLPKRTQAAGQTFRFEKLEDALKDLFN